MGSHSVKLAQRLREFRSMQELLWENADDEYSRGVYNGLEMAWCLMNGTDPSYIPKEIEYEE